MKVEEGETKVLDEWREKEWGKVSAVLFDMDGVLCNSEEPSRRAGVDVFAEMGVDVTVDDFVPFMGTGNSIFPLKFVSIAYFTSVKFQHFFGFVWF